MQSHPTRGRNLSPVAGGPWRAAGTMAGGVPRPLALCWAPCECVHGCASADAGEQGAPGAKILSQLQTGPCTCRVGFGATGGGREALRTDEALLKS